MAAVSYVVPSVSALPELREEYLAQKGGTGPGPVAARFFYRVCAVAAGITVLALVLARGW